MSNSYTKETVSPVSQKQEQGRLSSLFGTEIAYKRSLTAHQKSNDSLKCPNAPVSPGTFGFSVH